MSNKKNYSVRYGNIYVQGSVDGDFKKYSTGKQATKLNIKWIEKNHREVLLQLHNKKVNKTSIASKDFIEFAKLSLEINKPNRKDSTNIEYESIFKKYIEKYFKYYALEDIKKADLQKWQNSMMKQKKKDNELLSVGRIKFVRSVFSGILTDAVENELINKNPFETIKQPKREGLQDEEILPFNLSEINKIINVSIGQNKNLITTLFFTGMRTGELWGLKWSDLNFQSDTIHIQRAIRHGTISSTKTNSSNRIIEMLPIVKEALMRQKTFTYREDSFVFLNRDKKHFSSAASVSLGYWKRTLKFCKLDYRVLYQTRHTFASMMISQGEDIVWVSKTLGHASVKITLDIYTKFIPHERRERATFLNNFQEKNCTKSELPFISLSKSS